MLLIGKQKYPVESFAGASVRYQQARGSSPSSRMPRGIVHNEQGLEIAWVSYNGRVWSPGEPRELLCEAIEDNPSARRAD